MMNETLHGNNNQLHRPGLYEVVICLISYVLIVAIGAQVINTFGQSNLVFYGLSYSALSALSGIGAFLAAYSIRLRTKVPFGIRPISRRWLMIGVGFGVIVFILARGGTLLYALLGGTFSNVQEPYYAAATGGALSFSIQFILIAIATPIGEELAFRGVITSALLRYRPWVSITGSSLIFALAHGLNEIFIVAFITGLFTSYLFYRTKSIWPGVIVHIVHNALATILSFFIALML